MQYVLLRPLTTSHLFSVLFCVTSRASDIPLLHALLSLTLPSALLRYTSGQHLIDSIGTILHTPASVVFLGFPVSSYISHQAV
jgi:hypothetical protein